MENIYSFSAISPISKNLGYSRTRIGCATSIANGELFSLKNLNNSSTILKLQYQKSRHAFVVKAVAGADSSVETTKKENRELMKPVYSSTPPNRPLRTPHSGYHFDGSTRKFFEGWFFKVSIPECRQSFCFMYSVESPSFTKKLSSFEELQYGPRFTGVGAQILGADDKYICQYSEDSSNFWGSRHELMLGNTFVAPNSAKPPNKEVRPQEFNRRVTEGFQVTPLWHQGSIRDDGR